VLGEQEVLVKPLGRHLARVRNVSGATTLPSGEIVPVLHVPDLLRTAARAGAAPKPWPAGQPGAPPGRILVVEDSPTVRTLLRRTLETAGYTVQTAADGVEALSILEHGSFAGVVSDVDMPRMNGIALTARIRADARLARLPVILLTALESTKQRERGHEAGASAYIVKSSSDQEDLLEALRGLTGNSAAPGEAREREVP
jgi:two-component system chemotaxis sensor kinase CheA